MNRDRMLELANFIETQDCQLFDMGTWFHQYDKSRPTAMANAELIARGTGRSLPANFCGTSGCIAGHCAVMALGVEETAGLIIDDTFAILKFARDYLELTEEQAKDLFVPTKWKRLDLLTITPEQAVTTIRNAVETGVMDWSHAVVLGEEEWEGK